jgi:hypothetical protein
MSVSHDELKRREDEWKKAKAAKKQAKPSSPWRKSVWDGNPIFVLSRDELK